MAALVCAFCPSVHHINTFSLPPFFWAISTSTLDAQAGPARTSTSYLPTSATLHIYLLTAEGAFGGAFCQIWAT